MFKFRNVLLQAAANGFAAGEISRDDLTRLRRFAFLAPPWKMYDLRTRVAGLAQAEGVLPEGIDWDSIPWDEILAFIQKLLEIILAFILAI